MWAASAAHAVLQACPNGRWPSQQVQGLQEASIWAYSRGKAYVNREQV
jgi:hypothetical protein